MTLKKQKELALQSAIAILKSNPKLAFDLWIAYGLDEPYRSQVWQRAKEVVAHEQLELKLE